MATINCEACEELRQKAPDFVVNGLTDDVCASLANDTGLSASSGNNDCTDLNNVADCLVGNMATEVDAYNVCDWKEFTKSFINNVWLTFKAIICALCGIWTNIHNLWTRVGELEDRDGELCTLIDNAIQPRLTAFGTLELASESVVADRRVGQRTNKIAPRPDDGNLNPYTKAAQNFGIAYGRIVRQSCAGSGEELLEWICPSHHFYKLEPGVKSGDILWKMTKSEALNKVGMSEDLWDSYAKSNWTWHESALSPSRQIMWLKLTVGTDGLSSNEMGIIYEGTSAPNEAITSEQLIANFNSASARVYRYSI